MCLEAMFLENMIIKSGMHPRLGDPSLMTQRRVLEDVRTSAVYSVFPVIHNFLHPASLGRRWHLPENCEKMRRHDIFLVDNDSQNNLSCWEITIHGWLNLNRIFVQSFVVSPFYHLVLIEVFLMSEKRKNSRLLVF